MGTLKYIHKWKPNKKRNQNENGQKPRGQKPLIQRIKGQVNHISDIERSDLKAKVYSILKKITKKLEKDFKWVTDNLNIRN